MCPLTVALNAYRTIISGFKYHLYQFEFGKGQLCSALILLLFFSGWDAEHFEFGNGSFFGDGEARQKMVFLVALTCLVIAGLLLVGTRWHVGVEFHIFRFRGRQ